MVPNQYAEVIRAINMGAAGSGETGSEFMRSMTGWAQSLMGKPEETKKKKESKGMLGLWGL